MGQQIIQIGELRLVADDVVSFDGLDQRTVTLLAAVGVSWALAQPVRSVEVVATRGRVAIARVVPIQGQDPIIPVVLARMGHDWRALVSKWFYHQWFWSDDWQGDHRRDWFQQGSVLVARMGNYVARCLTPDEACFLRLELAAALATAGAGV
jgi:hypothetical protein